MRKKMMILRDSEGKFSIVELNLMSRHSDMVQVAPPGFVPGDEKYISSGKDGRLIFDYDKKHKAAKKANLPAKKLAEKQKWNELTVIERIKSSIFKA